jgi:hypothetical protein
VQADQRRVANIQQAEADAIARLTQVVGDAKLADKIVAGIVEVERLQADPAGSAELEAARVRVQKLIETAGGEAASTLSRASADRWNRHMTVRADATRYGGQLALWNASPRIFASSKYFDSLTKRLSDTRIFLVEEPGEAGVHVRIEAQDKDRGIAAFDPGVPE